MHFRKLTEEERAMLQRNGCHADDWDGVQVSAGFDPQRMRGVRLGGSVRIGDLRGTLMVAGIERLCGIYDSTLYDCCIDGPVYLSQVGLLARYDVGPRVTIERVLQISVEGATSFGQGTRIRVINEGGGRAIPIFDRLAAPFAYVHALYRHDSKLIERLDALVDAYVQGRTATRGVIGAGAVIRNVATLRNAWVGEGAVIEGATIIDECTIASAAADPCRIGEGVVMRMCVALRGALVGGGSRLESCFIGQAVTVDRQFSAEHSAFFANSEAHLGESCSILAGPFTVTHHRSTLLIAAYLSFFNAGSGTNQSNHLYKLGPLHQGILERGCKTGSSSYLLWPARVGAFTTVIGKHTMSFDTSDMPFSVIDDEEGRSYVYPSVNLAASGIRRDGEKWVRRDRRKGSAPLDPVIFDVFSPYTVGKILRAIRRLKDIAATTKPDAGDVMLDGIYLHRVVLRMAIKQYEMAVQLFIGRRLVARLEGLEQGAQRAAIARRLESTAEGLGDWVDLAGLLAPASEVVRLLESVKDDRACGIDAVLDGFRQMYESYDRFAWNWCARLIEERSGKTPAQMAPEELCVIVNGWAEVTAKFNRLIELDAAKEFDRVRSTGFGVDGAAQTREADFCAVRGTLEDNAFIKALREESALVHQRAQTIIGVLRGAC